MSDKTARSVVRPLRGSVRISSFSCASILAEWYTGSRTDVRTARAICGAGLRHCTRRLLGVRSKNGNLGSYLKPVRDRRSGLPKILSPRRSQITDPTDASFRDIAAHKQMILGQYWPSFNHIQPRQIPDNRSSSNLILSLPASKIWMSRRLSGLLSM